MQKAENVGATREVCLMVDLVRNKFNGAPTFMRVMAVKKNSGKFLKYTIPRLKKYSFLFIFGTLSLTRLGF